MAEKLSGRTDLPNVVNAHINGTATGMVLVRLEFVRSQDHIEQIRAGTASPDSIELLIDPQKAQRLSEGLARMAQATIASQGLPKGKH